MIKMFNIKKKKTVEICLSKEEKNGLLMTFLCVRY